MGLLIDATILPDGPGIAFPQLTEMSVRTLPETSGDVIRKTWISLPVALLRNNRAWRYIALALALCPQSISHFLSSISFFIGVWTTDQTLSFFVFINFLLLGDALPCGTRTHGVQLPIRASSERLARSLRARPVFLGPAYLWGIGNSANRACSISHSYISPPTRIQSPLTITPVGT